MVTWIGNFFRLGNFLVWMLRSFNRSIRDSVWDLEISVDCPGVDNYKFYATSKTEERSAVESSSSISDVEAREAIYDRNRNAISENIRKSGRVTQPVDRLNLWGNFN